MTALFGIMAFLPSYAQNSWKDYEKAREILESTKLETRIGFLADSLCQGRATGTRGGVEAAAWLARQFEEIGLMRLDGSWFKSFKEDNGVVGRNVIGIYRGRKGGDSEKYTIIGAHFDHLGVLDGKHYPGADSNASGTAAMLTIAEMLKSRDNYGNTIIFVGFDGNEADMAGSRAFWKLIEKGRLFDPHTGRAITKDKISLMVNIDQIGATLSPLRQSRKDYIIMLGNHSISPSKRDVLYTCNRLFITHLDLGYDYYGSENFTKIFYRLSDQRPFVDNGIPAVLFTSGITMKTNKTYDNAESLDFPVLRRRILLMFHWLDKML